MRVRLLPGAAGTVSREHFLMSYVIDGRVAIDAGSIGLMTVEEQLALTDVFISHTHMDHIATLPIFLDNVFAPNRTPVRLHASAETQAALEQHLFNDLIWPDLVRIGAEGTKFFEWQTLVPGRQVAAGDLKVTPLALRHVIPTLGFLVESPTTAVAFISDTAPLDDVWERLGRVPRLERVILECSFPESMRWLAEKSMHLTPRDVAEQIARLGCPVTVSIVHTKPAFREQIECELADLSIPQLELFRPGEELGA
jgi:ribonuclease BN (tRNA processing enzyme)